MENDLPFWMKTFQVISTPIIAVIAAVITAYFAHRQWKTANERVVLDLFERRMQIYNDLRDAIKPVLANGRTTNEDTFKFNEARDRLPFFFGSEVQEYINQLYTELLYHAEATSLLESDAGDIDRDALNGQRRENFRKISRFYEEFPKLAAPYVTLHQKIR